MVQANAEAGQGGQGQYETCREEVEEEEEEEAPFAL